MKLYRKILAGVGIVGLAILSVLIVLLVVNKTSLELNVLSDEEIHVEYGLGWSDIDIHATYKETVFNPIGTKVEAVFDGEVDFSKVGRYPVACKASHKGLNISSNLTIVIEDTVSPVIELVQDKNHFTKPNEAYKEEGYKATDNYDGDITSSVKTEQKDGIIYYSVTDSSGNKTTVQREINYKDAVSPEIVLKGDASMKVNIGSKYEEPGYTATDDCDGDITKAVKVSGSVDTSKKGEYILTYEVKDSYGNLGTINRTVTVADVKAPKLSIKGKSTMYVKLGSEFKEPGYSANDKEEGDLTNKVVVSGKVDTKKEGDYVITYRVKDSSGNTSVVRRTVYVYRKQLTANSKNPGKKVVYLTFDDGPGPYTKRLLDILDKYGVKATFFVTNQNSKYQDMIGEADRRGHTIALHTYSHNWDIYKSEEAYYKDLEKIQAICVKQTGKRSTIVRFPGGTSNTVSRKKCKGIMTKLTESLSYHGYLYCDWNVSSGDAGGTTSRDKVVKNVISGIKKHNVSIVLQHDIKKYSVEAVEEILAWGLANGYTFLPMTESTPMVHQRPNN